MAFPPDTDTPLLAEENKSKVGVKVCLLWFLLHFCQFPFYSLFIHLFVYFSQPLETKLISETSGVWQPDQVAKILVRDAVVRESSYYRACLLFFLCFG